MYRIFTTTYNGVEQTSIIRDNGNNQYTSFPADPDNANYQQYLEWVAEGNTAEPAE